MKFPQDKTDFCLKLFDDEYTKNKLKLLSKLEVAFDDHRNILPEAYFEIVENAPLGSSFKITIEIIRST